MRQNSLTIPDQEDFSKQRIVGDCFTLTTSTQENAPANTILKSKKHYLPFISGTGKKACSDFYSTR